MGLISFITNFYVYSKIDKYMIQPVKEANNEDNGDEIENVFSDSQIINDTEENASIRRSNDD